tara:strand:- start:278 stop:715 length:438 start_codon:yes stop_codon:yes gene_type:complete
VQINWLILDFKEINNFNLYQLLKLRSKVFVVEQNCVYQDLDDKDQKAKHIIGVYDNQVIACSRVLFEKGYYLIGRIIVEKKYRRKNIGQIIVNKSIQYILSINKKNKIKISAQARLNDFYIKLGFIKKGKKYMEDGILHQAMYYE